MMSNDASRPGSRLVRVFFELSEQEWRPAYRAWLRMNPRRLRKHILPLQLTAGLLIVSVVAALALRSVLSVAIAALLLLLFASALWRRRALRARMYRCTPGAGRRVDLTLNEDGYLCEISGEERLFIRWDAFEAWHEAAAFLLLDHGTHFYMLPRRKLSRGQLLLMRAVLNEHVKRKQAHKQGN